MTINVIGFQESSFRNWIFEDLQPRDERDISPSLSVDPSLEGHEYSIGNGYYSSLRSFNFRDSSKKLLLFVPGFIERGRYRVTSSDNFEQNFYEEMYSPLSGTFNALYSKLDIMSFYCLLDKREKASPYWDFEKFIINTDSDAYYGNYPSSLFENDNVTFISDRYNFLKLRFQELYMKLTTFTRPSVFWIVISESGNRCWMATPSNNHSYTSESLLASIEQSSYEPPRFDF